MPDHIPACPPPSAIVLHGRRLHLSETQTRVLAVLLTQPGSLVPDTELLQLLPGTTVARLQKHMIRLYATLLPHGLVIGRLARRGFVLVADIGEETMAHPRSSTLLELRSINGHRIQGWDSLHLLVIDGEAYKCSPLEYQVAARLLHAPPGQLVLDRAFPQLSDSHLREIMTALRKRFSPVGVTIERLPGYGYLWLPLSPPQGLPQSKCGSQASWGDEAPTSTSDGEKKKEGS